MTSDGQKVLLRYWGSHLKSPQQVEYWRDMLAVTIQRGWRCYLALERPPEDPAWLASITRVGVEPVFIPRARCQFDWGCARRVSALCRSLKVDAFHCENIFCSPLIGAFLAGVPARFWTKQLMETPFAECRPPTLRERMAPSTRVACQLSTRVVAVSEAVNRELLSMGISANRIVVRHLPRAGKALAATDRASIRAALGYASSDVVLATVGHSVPVKGWDVLLKAFQQVSQANPNARLLLIGSHSRPHEREWFEQLQAWVAQADLGSRVKFLGYVPDLHSHLNATDVFVFPSRSEACSLALLEGLDLGLPCVATRVGAAEQSVQDGINGFLVERNNPLDLAEKLQLLAGNPELRLRLARAARIPDCFPTLAEFGGQLCDLYESFLPPRQAPATRPTTRPA